MKTDPCPTVTTSLVGRGGRKEELEVRTVLAAVGGGCGHVRQPHIVGHGLLQLRCSGRGSPSGRLQARLETATRSRESIDIYTTQQPNEQHRCLLKKWCWHKKKSHTHTHRLLHASHTLMMQHGSNTIAILTPRFLCHQSRFFVFTFPVAHHYQIPFLCCMASFWGIWVYRHLSVLFYDGFPQ